MSVAADNMEEILDAPVIAAAPPKLTLWQRLNLSMEHIMNNNPVLGYRT